MGYKIIIIDRDLDVDKEVYMSLKINDYSIQKATTVQTALEMLEKQGLIDLVIINLISVSKNKCLAVINDAERFGAIPVLYLVNSGSQILFANGDHCLRWPFASTKLYSHVSHLLKKRRSYESVNILLHDGRTDSFLIDPESRLVIKNGKSISLTQKEYMIFQIFINHRGTPISIRSIYEIVWKECFLPASSNTVMVHVLNLRKKLEDNPAHPTLIRTVWGKGYQVD